MIELARWMVGRLVAQHQKQISKFVRIIDYAKTAAACFKVTAMARLRAPTLFTIYYCKTKNNRR